MLGSGTLPLGVTPFDGCRELIMSSRRDPSRSFRLPTPAFCLNCLKLYYESMLCGGIGPDCEFWLLGFSASDDFFWLKSRLGEICYGTFSTWMPVGGDEDDWLLCCLARRNGFF